MIRKNAMKLVDKYVAGDLRWIKIVPLVWHDEMPAGGVDNTESET